MSGAVILLICIREVPASNLLRDVAYYDSGVSSVPLGKCWNSTLKLGYDPFLAYHFYFIIRLATAMKKIRTGKVGNKGRFFSTPLKL
jgi:hypothetical protein